MNVVARDGKLEYRLNQTELKKLRDAVEVLDLLDTCGLAAAKDASKAVTGILEFAFRNCRDELKELQAAVSGRGRRIGK